jgi:carbon-monoxide dehydrogenase small subunit
MITFELNGEGIQTDIPPTTRLIDLLREKLGLIGTKEGCGEGECGACSVLVNQMLQNSCLIPLGSLQGAKVMTIEGYRKTPQYEVLSEAYAEAGAVQCGFCTPGMLLASEALLLQNPRPTEEEIREALSGNLCRCTGYNMIVDAVLLAAKKGEGLW